MKNVIINGQQMKSKDTVHMYLKYQLNVKGYDSKNLDSLSDALSVWDKSLKITLKNQDILLEFLKDYGEQLIKVFEDAAEQNENIIFEMV